MEKYKKIIIGIGGVLLIFITYQLTSSSGIGWIDSGIIAAAAKTLGIANPPGFPAYLLTAHLFTLIPWGTTVFNLKLLSQFSAIGIAGGIFGTVWYLSPPNRKIISATVAALCMAFSYNLWSQANNIETYTLTNLILLSFFIWLIWSEKKLELWQLPVLGLLGGLSLGLNPMIVCIGPAVLWWIFRNRKTLWSSPIFLFLALITGVIGGVIIYSYLPLRASTHPFIDWGDPVNWDRIRTHLFGSGLNIYEPETNSINGFTGQPKIFLESFLRYLYLALFQFTPILFPLVLWGGLKLWEKNRPVFELVIAVILGNLAFVVLYYGGNQESWTITSWMMLAIFLGYGIAYLPNRFYRFWILVLALVPLVFWFPLLNRTQDFYAQNYAKMLYRAVPENSVIIGGGDFFNSLTAFTHEVTGERKDIIPVTGNMFYIFPWYRENLRRNTNLTISPRVEDMIKFKSVDEFTSTVDQLIADNPGRTFFVTSLLLRESVVAGTDKGNYHTSKYVLVPHGLLFQVMEKKFALKPNEKLFDFPVFGPAPFYLERNYNNAYKLLRNDYAVAYAQLGDYLIQQNNAKQAELYFQKAVLQSTSDTSEFVHRLAIFYAQTGQNDLARKSFESSLARDPDNTNIKQNFQAFLQQTQTASSSADPKTKTNSPGQFKAKSGLTFDFPQNWLVKEKNEEVFISDPTSNFSIQISKNFRQTDVTIEEYMNKQAIPPGQLLEQGLAKIPNTDLAYVRVINNNNKPELEFFLFKANVVLRVLVGPSDSQQMKIFDAIITSLKL